MSNDIQEIGDNTLDEFIKRLEEISNKDKNGVEFWYARELKDILEYAQWRRFEDVIEKAKITCKQFNQSTDYHFANVGKMIEVGKKAKRDVSDYKLTRYACYLIAQNGDIKAYATENTKYSTLIFTKLLRFWQLYA